MHDPNKRVKLYLNILSSIQKKIGLELSIMLTEP